MAIESLILGVRGFVFLLILAGAFLAVQEAKAGSFHTVDFFFLAGIAIAFIVANYLWFFCQRTRSGRIGGDLGDGGRCARALFPKCVYANFIESAKARRRVLR